MQPLFRDAKRASEGDAGASISDARFHASWGNPRQACAAGRYGVRIAILAALIFVHVWIVLQLAEFRGPQRVTDASDRMSLTWVTVQPDGVEALSRASPAPIMTDFKLNPQSPDFGFPLDVEAEWPSRAVDWKAEAARAVAEIAADEPDTRRSLGPREPRNQSDRPPKPFGWDLSQTERVQALPEGGTVIRLNDYCSLVIVPVPLVGCALGKIEARGDLFDGMDRPSTLGDWKEDDRPP